MTEKLFYSDSHLSHFTAEVLSCVLKKERWEIELDRTAFFPEGGGQYSDTGKIGDARIVDVQEKDGRVLHFAESPVEIGTRVECFIDWHERFMKMQQHTGEHIVSGLINSRFGYRNVGFHLGHEDCTMDFSGEITPMELQDIELQANYAVWKNIEVRTLYPNAEQLETIKYRSKIEISGQIRIVEIPGYDCCACCAPHVSRTGEIGIIKFTNMQRYKGGVRVTMLCGIRALKDYALKHEENRKTGAILCVKENETAEAVERLKQECTDLKYKAGEKEKRLAEYIAGEVPKTTEPVCLFPTDIEGEALRILMNQVLKNGHILCAVFERDGKGGYKYVLGSREVDVRSFAKEFNGVFDGRGGGKPEMVQGTVRGSETAIKEWILEKAGRIK